MYAALLNKSLVTAVAEADCILKHEKQLNDEQYLCPHCQQRVLLVLSEQKNPFFKHIRLVTAQEGEKWEHHQSKILLQTALAAAGFAAKCEVELAHGELRADVFASSRLCFEVQCAPLSEREFNHRHQLYRKEGITDIWIVGRRHFLQRRLKKTQLIFIRKNTRWGYYLLEILPRQARIRLKYNICEEPLTRQVHYQQASFALDECGMVRLWFFSPRLKEYTFAADKQRQYLQKQLQIKSRLGQKIGELLYQKHLTIDDLPQSLFTNGRPPGAISAVIVYLQKNSAS